MALNSPGVEVKVIDESFYVPAEPGTRPLLIVASKQNKANASGTGIAVGTLKANAGKPYIITSQRELAETFGTPLFYKDSSQNPMHGGEMNEYGLQAAYSYLGVSNSAIVIRADLDMAQLSPVYESPSANPPDGTYWLDTQNTRLGIFEWNSASAQVKGGQTFTNKVPTIITDVTLIDDATGAPIEALGKIGDYAMVSISTLNKIYYKNRKNAWVLVGTPEWNSSLPVVTGTKVSPLLTQGHKMIINGVTVELTSGITVAALAADITSANIRGVTAEAVEGCLTIYSDGAVDSDQMDSTLSNEITIALAGPTNNLVASTAAASAIGIAIGKYYGPALKIGPHTSVPRFKRKDFPTSVQGRPSGSIWIKTTDVNLGARWRVKEWSSNINDWAPVQAPVYASNQEAIYKLDRIGGGKNIAAGTVFVQYDVGEDYGSDDTPRIATFKLYRRQQPDPTTITSIPILGGTLPTFSDNTVYTFNMAETLKGVATFATDKVITFEASGVAADARTLAAAINAAGYINVIAEVDSRNRLVIKHEIGGELRFKDVANDPITSLFVPYNVDSNSGTPNFYDAPTQSGFKFDTEADLVPDDVVDNYTVPGDTLHDYMASSWKPLKYTPAGDPPNVIPEDGTLWFNPALDQVDIMIHNGNTWVGYLDTTSPNYDSDAEFQTDPAGPIVSATKPTLQSDGTTLRDGDLWVDSGDRENYPSLYRWDGINLKWIPIDVTDQTTEDGIIFADARFNTSGVNSDKAGAIADLLVSNFIDVDTPDPDLYPRGMLLFNTRRSGNNVKRFAHNYIDTDADNIRFNSGESMELYYKNRWINESGNAADGSGLFGRKAQRKVVVKHLKAMVDTNYDLREQEMLTFNLMACPGYVELIANMINLNIDRKQTAFVVGDTPFRLPSDATSLNTWGKNAKLAVDNGEDGLVSYDEYTGVYYPSAFTTDNTGNDIVVPASHMVLRTIALSDGVSYPWFAPAGTRRGVVKNATSVGYIKVADGEWKSISLNEGQRDTLYAMGINPVTFMTGAGIVVYGQKTRASNASALDRINVARLVVYLRGQLTKLAKPYIFEPNDKITRDEIKGATESLMLELVGQRAIYDYLVVCDDSNNTPSRIDRNELYLDIAIEPVKSVEFIYIPLRLKNTGEIAGLK